MFQARSFPLHPALITTLLLAPAGCQPSRPADEALTPATARARPQAADDELRRRVDAVLDDAVAHERIGGAVVLVARDGQVVYRRAMGAADREGGKLMTFRTQFRLASMTKPIVSAVALRLVEAGVLQLDDRVSRFLPAFRPPGPDGKPAEITLRQLLTHTSGLSYGFWQAPGGTLEQAGVSSGLDQPGLSLEENLGRLAQVPLAFEPGRAWQYSLSIDVLGAALAKAARKPLPALVEELVARPLGASFAFSASGPQWVAKPYYVFGQRLQPMSEPQELPFGASSVRLSPARAFDERSFASGGAGSISTADDYLRFLEALRRGGAPLLSRASVESMTRDQVGEFAVELDGGSWGFGFGFAVLREAGAEAPFHPGTFRWGGVYGSHFFVDPSARLSVVVMTNTALVGMMGDFPNAIARAIYG